MLGTFIIGVARRRVALTVAMLMPLTVSSAPPALIMFAGSITARYVRWLDGSDLITCGRIRFHRHRAGNLMAKNGRAGPALATCAISSFVAGI
jgi:putative tricarboxylic transport membrane protein